MSLKPSSGPMTPDPLWVELPISPRSRAQKESLSRFAIQRQPHRDPTSVVLAAFLLKNSPHSALTRSKGHTAGTCWPEAVTVNSCPLVTGGL